MASSVICTFYRGQAVYVVPAICLKADLENDFFAARWQGIFPAMIPLAQNIAVHEDASQHDAILSWMIQDSVNFEPSTKQNLGRSDRLNLLFHVLNTLGIHLEFLRPEHILVRKHLDDAPFTHTPRPTNAPENAVPYHKNIVLLAGWHRTSQRMSETQLIKTREAFLQSLPETPPSPLTPSTKQPDGLWHCQEYSTTTRSICNATFHLAASLRAHLVELHEVPTEKLRNEVTPTKITKNAEGEEVEEVIGGMEKLGVSEEAKQDSEGRRSTISQAETDILTSEDGEKRDEERLPPKAERNFGADPAVIAELSRGDEHVERG